MGRNQVHELNRDHVAAAAALILTDLQLELWKRMRSVVGTWSEPAMYACVFGSAARGDGDDSSDIDILVVHKPGPEDLVTGDAIGWLERAAKILGTASARTPDQAAQWATQLDDLHVKVQRWTGNAARIVDLPFPRWLGLNRTEPALHRAIEQDKMVLTDSNAYPRPVAEASNA